MAIRALNTAATGMNAQTRRIDVIANNLANVNTTGFRRDRLHFTDLFYEKVALVGAPMTSGRSRPVGLQVGNGVRVAASEKEFSPGGLENTGNQYHMAIEGEGNLFFKVRLPDGRMAYTRSGNFVPNAEGNLTTVSGNPLMPDITVPAEAKKVEITPEGEVSYYDGQNRELQDIGQISLARFVNPAGLQPEGENLFVATAASGEPQDVMPGQEGTGRIRQRFLEQSNVNAISELIKMIKAQRSYEMDSNVVKTADEALQIVNNIKR